MLFAIPTQRNPANRNDFLNFQKDTVRDTILILVYIHTYPVFARRINIVHLMRASRNPSACHGKRSNISGVEICLRESVESSKNRLILIWSKNVSFPLKRSRSTLTKSPPIFFENLARNS